MDDYRSQLASVDIGNLLVEDPTPLDLHKVAQEDVNSHIEQVATENMQLILNKLWELSREQVDEHVVVKMPVCKFRLPREKRAPTMKALTKWDRYAKIKGIQKKKRSRMVWDEVADQWKPRWGKDRINDDKKKWCIEVPENADPMEDQFEKLKKAKRETIAKNELQRLRNIARNVKGKVPPLNPAPGSTHTKGDFGRALTLAEKSDASLGLFSKPAKLRDDPKQKQGKGTKAGKKGTQNRNAQKGGKGGSSKRKPMQNTQKGGKGGSSKRKPMQNKGSRTGNKKK